MSAYLTEVLHYEDTVRDGTVLSGELKSFCPLTWQRFSTTRTLSGTEQSCPAKGTAVQSRSGGQRDMLGERS